MYMCNQIPLGFGHGYVPYMYDVYMILTFYKLFIISDMVDMQAVAAALEDSRNAIHDNDIVGITAIVNQFKLDTSKQHASCAHGTYTELDKLAAIRRDDLAHALMPSDVPTELFPVVTSGNGDCLYNAVSLQIQGIDHNSCKCLITSIINHNTFFTDSSGR